jgi:enoyl-CoA hydratase
MNYENILITTENNIATITINRPKNWMRWTSPQFLIEQSFQNISSKRWSSCYCFNGKWWKKAFVAVLIFLNCSFLIEEGTQLAAEGQEKLFDFVENSKTP